MQFLQMLMKISKNILFLDKIFVSFNHNVKNMGSLGYSIILTMFVWVGSYWLERGAL